MAGRYRQFTVFDNEELVARTIREGIGCSCDGDAPFTSDIEIGEYIGNTYYERYGEWEVHAICLRCHRQATVMVRDSIFRRRPIMDQGEYDFVHEKMLKAGCRHERLVTVSPWQIEKFSGRKVRIAACRSCHRRFTYDKWVDGTV